MATLAIVLNTSKKLSNEEYSVSLRVTHLRVSKYFAIARLLSNQGLKFQCTIDKWMPSRAEDNGLGKFKKSQRDYKLLNTILEKKLSDARNLLSQYDNEDVPFSFERFEADLRRGQLPTRLQDYYQLKMDELESQNKLGLYTIYEQTQRQLKNYKSEALITDIDIKFLEGFESFLKHKRNNKDTTIGIKMRNIQRVMNLAIEDKLVKPERYPFGEKKYSINKRLNSKTRKRSIPLELIKKIKLLQFEKGTGLHLAQQMFMFSFYTRGMNFVDMSKLKWSDIEGNEINYYRQKTRQLFQIPVNEHIEAILNEYRNNDTAYIFPIFDDIVYKTERERFTRRRTVLKKVNDRLKDVAKLIGEEQLKLTTYVSRHSYATNLKRAGVATSYISEALGHQTEEMTQTYLDEFEKGVISQMENKIFDL